jgi:hypothetical protein
MLHTLACLVYILFALSFLVIAYAVSGLAKLVITQYFSHLGELNCPPVPSFFWGHLQLLHDAENTNLYMKWREQMGTIFTYRGFIGVWAALCHTGVNANQAVSRAIVSSQWIPVLLHIYFPYHTSTPNQALCETHWQAWQENMVYWLLKVHLLVSSCMCRLIDPAPGDVHKRQVRYTKVSESIC